MDHELLVLGAGAALASPMAKSCAVLDDKILIDAGSDPTSPLRQHGINPLDITDVLVTHLHGDHFFGIAFLIAEGMLASQQCPSLQISGPVGTRDALLSLLQLAYPMSDPKTFLDAREVNFREVQAGDTFMAGNWEVKVLAQEHGRMEAYAYILVNTNDEMSIGFTGDGNPPLGTIGELAKCRYVIVNTPTLEEPLPAHASLARYLTLAQKANCDVISVHRTFENADTPGVLFPKDGDRIRLISD